MTEILQNEPKIKTLVFVASKHLGCLYSSHNHLVNPEGSFARFDPDNFMNIRHEDQTVTRRTGVSKVQNNSDKSVQIFIITNHFNFGDVIKLLGEFYVSQ